MGDGFDKIELNSVPLKSAPLSKQITQDKEMKGRVKLPTKKRINLRIIGLVVFCIVILGFFFLVLPAIDTYRSAAATYKQGKLVADAIKDQNVATATVELEKTKKKLDKTQKNLHRLSYLRFIPILNWYYNDADHLLKAGDYSLESGKLVLEAIEPYTDILGLKGKSSFVMGSAEDRIKTAVMTIGKITPQ